MRWAMVLVLALFSLPHAGAMSVVTDPPTGSPIVLGSIPRDAEVRIPVTVWVNCTVGEVALDGITLSLDPEDADRLLVVADPPEQTTAGPNLCMTDADDVRFDANLTVAWSGVVDATSTHTASVGYRVSQSSGLHLGEWSLQVRQAFDPRIDVSLPEGFEYQTTPDRAFDIPVRVFNEANAPVRASVEVRTLSPYEARTVRAPPPQTIDWIENRPREARLLVVGHTYPAVGNVNQTIVLEIRVQVVPLDVDFADFHTVRRLFVAHVQVTHQHLRPVGEGAAPDISAAFVAVAFAAAAAIARYSSRAAGRRW